MVLGISHQNYIEKNGQRLLFLVFLCNFATRKIILGVFALLEQR